MKPKCTRQSRPKTYRGFPKVVVGDPVVVEWGDAWMNPTEYFSKDRAAANIPMPTRTIGFVLSATESGVTVAMSDYGPQPSPYRGTFFIPAGMVKEVRVLK